MYGLSTTNSFKSFIDSDCVMDVVIAKTKVHFSANTRGVGQRYSRNGRKTTYKHLTKDMISPQREFIGETRYVGNKPSPRAYDCFDHAHGTYHPIGTITLTKQFPSSCVDTTTGIISQVNGNTVIYMGTDTGYSCSYNGISETSSTISLHNVEIYGWNYRGHRAGHVSGNLYIVVSTQMPSNPSVPSWGMICRNKKNQISYSSNYEPLRVAGIIDYYECPKGIFMFTERNLPSGTDSSRVVLFAAGIAGEAQIQYAPNHGNHYSGGDWGAFAFPNGKWGYRPNYAYQYSGSLNYASWSNYYIGLKGIFIYGKDYL